jgi:hypothetical protein
MAPDDTASLVSLQRPGSFIWLQENKLCRASPCLAVLCRASLQTRDCFFSNPPQPVMDPVVRQILTLSSAMEDGVAQQDLCVVPTQCVCVSPVRYGLPTVYLCVPYGSHSKQRLFPHTALTGWAL